VQTLELRVSAAGRGVMSRATPLRLLQPASWAAALPVSFPKEGSFDREGLVPSRVSSLILPPASDVPREAIIACICKHPERLPRRHLALHAVNGLVLHTASASISGR